MLIMGQTINEPKKSQSQRCIVPVNVEIVYSAIAIQIQFNIRAGILID